MTDSHTCSTTQTTIKRKKQQKWRMCSERADCIFTLSRDISSKQDYQQTFLVNEINENKFIVKYEVFNFYNILFNF